MKRSRDREPAESHHDHEERHEEVEEQWTLVTHEPHFVDSSAPLELTSQSAETGTADFLPSVDGSDLAPSAPSVSLMAADGSGVIRSSPSSSSQMGLAPSAPSASSLMEVCLNNSELCSQPVMEFDSGLVVAAEPARLFQVNFFRQSQREYSLVLLNPRDHSRGLRLARGTQDSMRQRAECLLAELRGDEKLASVDAAALYDRLLEDDALRRHLARQAQGQSHDPACCLDKPSGSSCSQPAASSSSSTAPPPATQEGETLVDNGDDEQECPICLDVIPPGGAAMRCVGTGGRHHYFHARCLQQWVATGNRTCPVCRGAVQFNRERLNDYLSGRESESLPAEARSCLQTIADGLQHKNAWSNMTGLERTAYAGGMVAAAGSGFLMGWYNVGSPIESSSQFFEEHHLVHNIGWLAGIFGRVARDILRSQERRDRRDRD
mmetsp:Transcript_29153/g.53205  ORF Transcript_29153/g.53205 Transcript_29153/m.53205 type:complete len:436 (+) Transcript_29153:55-1362(+)